MSAADKQIGKHQWSVMFVTLAMNQTRFFEVLGGALVSKGCDVAHLCFHERSWEYLTAKGLHAYNGFAERSGGDREIRFSDFGIDDVNLSLSHEQAAFELRDSAAMRRRLASHLATVNHVIDDWQRRKPGQLVVVQELGGFLSNIAAFYAARSKELDNVFIEPSFFRGRVFFVRNSFAAPVIQKSDSRKASNVVREYLEQLVAQRRILIPVKDTHNFRQPLHKLVDARNWRRLIEKLVDKFILGKREQFGHVGGHVKRYVRMFLNGLRLRRYYRPLPEGNERLVYYPLHVPADVALTIRSPEYLDQYALIDLLARTVPDGYKVVTKEHPAMVGAVNFQRMRDLFRSRDNVLLLRPDVNNHEVVRRAEVVVTVNSKAGSEALVAGKPVIVLGDAFYADAPGVIRVTELRQLPEALRSIVQQRPSINRAELENFFEGAWAQSYPGELYDCSPSNAVQFGESLVAFMESNCGRDLPRASGSSYGKGSSL